MSILNAIRNHPLHLALALVVGFAAWVAHDAYPDVRKYEPGDGPPPPNFTAVSVQPSDQMLNVQPRDPSKPGVVTADLIPRLVPGMARVAVEELIGQPPASLVHPVAMVDGKFIYRASYLANLDAKSAAPAARSIIALEYDAGVPGHPLLRVHIPDPMS
jgi:hypothetical protein